MELIAKDTCSTTLEHFFNDSIDSAVRNQSFAISCEARWYVVNVLVLFSRADYGPPPSPGARRWPALALIYKQAHETSGFMEKTRHFRYLGDLALVVAGVYSDSLRRHCVDVDYYIGMGGGAYAFLSEHTRLTEFGSAQSQVFAELSNKFSGLVDILDEVHEKCMSRSERPLSRLSDLWRRTGSARVKRQLNSMGVGTLGGAATPRPH